MISVFVLGCTGDEGVRVVVQLDEAAWDERRPISHIRVVAESEEGAKAGCLFPKSALPEALELSKADDPHGCANAETLELDFDLAWKSWGFDAERSINFIVPTGSDVRITASAGFGGRLDLFTAEADVPISGAFEPRVLQLLPTSDEVLFGPGGACPVQLSSVRGAPFRCGENRLGDCVVRPGGSLAFNRHTSAVTDLGGEGCRIENAAGKAECSMDEYDDLVAFGAFFDVSSQQSAPEALVSVRGRFAQCADGSSGPACPLTAACTPPRSAFYSVGLSELNVPVKLGSAAWYDCIPSSVTPMEFVFKLPAAAGAPVHASVLLQEFGRTETPGTCFFDLFELVVD